MVSIRPLGSWWVWGAKTRAAQANGAFEHADAGFGTPHAGIECHNNDDELSLLWDKLVFLAPLALATTAAAAPLGAVRNDDQFVGCREEAIAVAQAEGAKIDAAAIRTLHERAPADIRSSMQKDVEAGHQPELDAIAGPIIRAGTRHGISTPNTITLTTEINANTLH